MVLIQNCEYIQGLISSARENCGAQLRNDFTSFFFLMIADGKKKVRKSWR